VKRTAIILTGIATLGLAAYVGGLSRAQEQGQQPVNAAAAAPKTKVAVINIMGVVKNYQKWLDFEKAYKDGVKRYDDEFERKKAELLRLKTDLEKSTVDADKEKLSGQMKTIERQAQDLSEEAKRELTKFREAQAVQIYKEIQEATIAYARARDFGLVLHYADATAPAEYYHPVNVLRKLQQQACLPIYVDPELDITKPVTEMLNARLATPHGS